MRGDFVRRAAGRLRVHGPDGVHPRESHRERAPRVSRSREVGGPALAAPHGVATLSTGDATVFDSRLLHCGGGNASEKRRVLFYFSFEVAGSDNPNSAVSTIREELRGKYTLADLR